ncbi:MAG: endonuclease III domain-containing protein, partial [Firmicutes bacterium]|nr:endonuclease III domain-containing protein [Bacillota bacterium]
MIPRIFRKLFDHYGPQHWWPAATPFEVAVGAILTQSVSWANVEKAIANLRREGLLEPQTIHAFADSSRGEERLGELIRPSGYFRVKARKLLSFSGHLQARHGGSLDRLFAAPTGALRAEILGIW